jgi:hypothetical protein
LYLPAAHVVIIKKKIWRILVFLYLSAGFWTLIHMEILVIERLKEITPSLDPMHCDFLSSNCIAALEQNQHKTGCMLSVTGDSIIDFRLQWSRKVVKASFEESRDVTKNAAEAIAFFLTPELTAYSVVRKSETGTGFDYWLSYDEKHPMYQPKNFLMARLEVSGIRRETKINTIQKRIDKKKATGK